MVPHRFEYANADGMSTNDNARRYCRSELDLSMVRSKFEQDSTDGVSTCDFPDNGDAIEWDRVSQRRIKKTFPKSAPSPFAVCKSSHMTPPPI
jgi:hypothetical protein